MLLNDVCMCKIKREKIYIFIVKADDKAIIFT